MTREEAIKLLHKISDQCCEIANILCTEDADKRCDALSMAIEALSESINCVKCKHYYETEEDSDIEGRCKMDTAHTDLIRRADAIEGIKKEIQDFETTFMHEEDNEEYGHDIGFVSGLHRAKTFIRSLPSADRLYTHEEVWGMCDLIRRTDAIDAVQFEIIPYRRYHKGEWLLLLSKREVLNAINALPSANALSSEDYEDIITDYRKQYEDMNNEIADLEAKYETLNKAYKEALADRPHGEWIRKPIKNGELILWKCSECGAVIYSDEDIDWEHYHAYCGACGAKMGGDIE